MKAYPTLFMTVITCTIQNTGYDGNDSLAVVGKVNAKVHEIVLSPTRLVNDSFKHGLVHFVRNIPKHNLQKGQREFRVTWWIASPWCEHQFHRECE
jgi:hypothetical protein